MRLGILDEPFKGPEDVGLCGLRDGIPGVVGQDDHVLALVVVVLGQEGRDVVDVVDAPPELCLLADVVDADQQGLAGAGTLGVLECVSLRGARAKVLRTLWRRRPRAGIVGIAAALLLLLLLGITVGVVALRRRPLRGGILVGRASPAAALGRARRWRAPVAVTAASAGGTVALRRRGSVAALLVVVMVVAVAIRARVALAWIAGHDATKTRRKAGGIVGR